MVELGPLPKTIMRSGSDEEEDFHDSADKFAGDGEACAQEDRKGNE